MTDMIVIRQSYVKRADLRANPRVAYLFGDNLLRTGMRGQAAEMRGEPNAIGIPTKKRPSMGSGSFLLDSEYADNKKLIDDAFEIVAEYEVAVVPLDGLGTGLARLPEIAPLTFRYIESKIAELGASHE